MNKQIFIGAAGAAGGVSAPVSKSYSDGGRNCPRVDIEVIKGRAFVPPVQNAIPGKGIPEAGPFNVPMI